MLSIVDAMDFAPVIASTLAAFVTASVTSWAALRTTNATWHAVHADRTFNALADLLDATDPGRQGGQRPLVYASASNRVRITTGGAIRDLAEEVIAAAFAFNQADAARWRSRHPYFQLLDALRANARGAEARIDHLLEEDDPHAVALEAVDVLARDALERFYARQGVGEAPDPTPVRRALTNADCFEAEEIDALLLPPAKRHAFHQSLDERYREDAERRAALANAHKKLADALAASTAMPPGGLARRLRRR